MISFHDIEKTVDLLLYGRAQLYYLADEWGGQILSFKSMLKAEFKSNGRTVFEPIEENSFATYNKTSEPREFYFEVALQWPNQDFGVILGKLENLKVGTDLFMFVTPWNSYSNLTLEGYTTNFETTTSMLIVGLQCKEVKEVRQGYTNVTVDNSTPIDSSGAKNPDNVSTSDTGITGTSAPTTEEQKQTRESIAYGVFGDITGGVDGGGAGGGFGG